MKVDSLSQPPEVQDVPATHLGTETKNFRKEDVLHLEATEYESGPGHCLTIQWLHANIT